MMWQEAIALARAAIESGDLAAAQDYKQRAQMLKELDMMGVGHGEKEYEDEDEKMYVEEMKAMRNELEALKAFRSQLENEPAVKSAGHLVVTEDETDKMANAPFKSLGEQLFAVPRRACGLIVLTPA